jgi:hypothetical protein
MDVASQALQWLKAENLSDLPAPLSPCATVQCHWSFSAKPQQAIDFVTDGRSAFPDLGLHARCEVSRENFRPCTAATTCEKLSLVESFRVIFELFRAQLNVLGRIEHCKTTPVRHTEALEDAQGDVAQQ